MKEKLESLATYLWALFIACVVAWCVFGTLFRPDLDPGTLLDAAFEAVLPKPGTGVGMLVGLALIAVYAFLWLFWQVLEPFWTCAAGLGLVLSLLAVVSAPAILANRASALLPDRLQLPGSVVGLLTALALTVGAVSQRPEGWTGQLYWRHTMIDDLCSSLSCKRSGFLGPGEGVDVSMVEIPLQLFWGPADLRSPTVWLEPQLILVRAADSAITYRVAGDLTLSGETAILMFFEGILKVLEGLLEGALLYTLVWSVLMIICTWANPYLLLAIGFAHAVWRVWRDR